MQETVEQMSTQMTEKWNELPKDKKTKLMIGVTALLITIIIAALFFSRPKMEVLYHKNLDPKEIAQVVTVLDEQKITYNVIDNGTNVEVQDKSFNQAKLALAQANIPKGGYAFSDAIDNSMSTTESEREAKLHKLAEVELENALMSMDDISYADVALVMPEEKNSFMASKQSSSASVLLTVDTPLSTKEVEGIARFISSSVANLSMNAINIIDTEGNSLYIGQDEGSLTTNKQQELKLAAENTIKTKVTQLLEPMYDEVRISPNLILDFSQYEEVREEYKPQVDTGKGVISSESTQNQTATNRAQGSEPGMANNGGDVPVYQVGGATGSESKSTQKDTQYQNDKIVSNTIKNQGDIDYKNSSLAVHVFKEKVYEQAAVEKTLDQASSWEDFKQMNKESTPIVVEPGIVESIKTGTGIGNVAVYGYEKPIFVDTVPYEIDYKDYLPFILILLIFIVLGLALFKFRKHDDEVETEPELEVEQMLSVARQEIELEEIEVKETLETKRQIEKFVDEKPEAVANLLRNWLTDDEWE